MASRSVVVDIETQHGVLADGKIEINGQDVARGCSGFNLDAKVGEIPLLTLFVPTLGVVRYRGEADVEIRVRPALATALIACGWSPPEGTDPEVVAALGWHVTATHDTPETPPPALAEGRAG